MTYVTWATAFEGPSDRAHLELLIPRVIEDIIIRLGTRHSDVPAVPAITLRRGDAGSVAQAACNASAAFLILFIHADTGGRALRTGLAVRSEDVCAAMAKLCRWPTVRCVTISPQPETEAWVLADIDAVMSAMGRSAPPEGFALPADGSAAERLGDPKALLSKLVSEVLGRRRRPEISRLFPAIAQRQDLPKLRRAPSFAAFEQRLHLALRDIGCV